MDAILQARAEQLAKEFAHQHQTAEDRYVSSEDSQAVVRDLKKIYQAHTVLEAEQALDAFAQASLPQMDPAHQTLEASPEPLRRPLRGPAPPNH